jgi:hypothetical protein
MTNRQEWRRAAKLAKRKFEVLTVINAQAYLATDGKLYWFEVPEGMDRVEAFKTQDHYGPFESAEEVSESQRVVLLGADCKVSYGGEWDPNWDKPQ